MIDPGTAMIAGSVFSGLGSLFGGGGGNKDAKRQFNIQTAPQIARLLEGAPLREKLMAIMGNLSDNPPERFVPSDLFNPTANGGANPALGGRSRESMMAPAGFKPSGQSSDMYRAILGQLGYGKYFPDPNAPAQPQGPQGGPMGPNPTVPCKDPWGFSCRGGNTFNPFIPNGGA